MTKEEALKMLDLPEQPAPEEVRSRFARLWNEGMAGVKQARNGTDWHVAQRRLERLAEARMALVGLEFGR